MKENKLEHFETKRVLSDKHIRQLIAYSHQDPDVLRFTRDAKRFGDYARAKQFLEKAQVYALVNNDELGGIIWFSPKPLPDKKFIRVFDKKRYDTTFAIRLYGEAKGKGLSLPFMEEAFSLFYQQNGQKGVWLQTRADNARAIHLYEKNRFDQVSEPDNDGRIIMIQF